MDLARYVVDALAPGSRRPHRSPQHTPDEIEDVVVALRKELGELGLDDGARTIAWHLGRLGHRVPAESTIQRSLTRRGFVRPQPAERPRRSYVRFEANLPNECWQADATHVALDDGTEVEVLNLIDDHSRLCVASVAATTVKVTDVLETFEKAAATWGFPASMPTHNAAVFNAGPRAGRHVFETRLAGLGIVYKHARPYRPQTCGKVERFHQTMKKFLAKYPPSQSVAQLQEHLDRFVGFYNDARPHRARRVTPHEAFLARDRARPGSVVAPMHFRVRTDRVDSSGRVTLRHESKLRHIMVGRVHAGRRIRLYVAGVDVRTFEGELLRHLELDPARQYQGYDREI